MKARTQSKLFGSDTRITDPHPYLLLSSAEWEASTANARHEVGEQIYKRILQNARMYSEWDFDELAGLPEWPRVFAWNNVLLELSVAANVSQEDEYLRKAAFLVHSLESTVNCGYGIFERFIPHGPGIVLMGAALCYDLNYNRFDQSERRAFEEVIQTFGRLIFEDSNNVYWGDDMVARDMWNHSMVGYSSMAYAALSLGNGNAETNAWLERSLPHIRNYFEVGITQEGVNREGLSYAGVTFKALAYTARALDRVLGTCLLSHEKISKYIEYFAFEMHPCGGLVQNFNDSYLDPRLALNGYLLLNDAIQSPIAPYVWNRLIGARGSRTYGDDDEHWRNTLFEAFLFYPRDCSVPRDDEVPLSSTRYFHEKGYLVSRTGWGENESVLAFSSGPGVLRIHQQSDHNSFTYFANRTPIIIDSGPDNKAEEGSRSQSFAHNCILIDGLGQALSGGKASTSGETIWYEGGDLFDYVIGNSALAYNQGKYNPVSRAIRHMCFVKRPFPYLLIWDDIEKTDRKKHTFEFVLHLSRIFNISGMKRTGNRFYFNSESMRMSLSVHFLNSEEVGSKCSLYGNESKNVDATVRQHPMCRFSVHSRNPNFVTLIAVSPGAPDDYGFRLSAGLGDGIGVKINWHTHAFEDRFDFEKNFDAHRSTETHGAPRVFRRVTGLNQI